MAKTIYLHIGSPKTGTTSIQHFLKRNQLKLYEDEKVLYPLAGRIRPDGFAHHALTWFFRHGKTQFKAPIEVPFPNKDDYLSYWHNLLIEIKDSKADKVILSAEGFSGYIQTNEEIQIIKSLLEQYDIRIIFYLRRQDEWLFSRHCQSLKTGSTLTFKKFANIYISTPHKANIYKKIKLWEGCFGKKHIILRNYCEPSIREDVIKDFCHIIQIPTYRSHKITRNVTPNVKTLKILRFINFITSGLLNWDCNKIRQRYGQFLISKDVQQSIDKYIPNWLVSNTFGEEELFDEIMSHYEDSNNQVAIEYFNRPTLFINEHKST